MSQYPLVGKKLRHRYRIVRLLGSGGFGDTYLSVDQDLPGQPQCVVKHFKPKNPNPAVLPIAKSLFEQEAQVLYRLGQKSDQIPQLFAHFEENGEFYLVQEFVDGHDLSKEMPQGLPKSENVVFKLLQDILEVLAFVHQHQVIHRDIKPQNLMRRRKDGLIVLIDFGAVKEIGTLVVNAQGQTSHSVAVGTAGYMPSEQAKGNPKFGSDVYAVGMIGIQALTGLEPRQLKEDPKTGEVMWRDLAQVSDSLADVIDTMVRDHFSQRYQSAAEALQGLISSGQPAPPPQRLPLPSGTTSTTIGSRSPTSSESTVVSPAPDTRKSPPWKALIGLGVVASVAAVAGITRLIPTPPKPAISPPSLSAPTVLRPGYTRLQELLAARNWKEAERETNSKMLEVAGRQKEGSLRAENIANLSCEDLRTIDQLWKRFSNGHFGFSVQKHIWENVGGKLGVLDDNTYIKYGERVGWFVDGEWLTDNQLTYGINAPQGHLPGTSRVTLSLINGKVGLGSKAQNMFFRLEACKL